MDNDEYPEMPTSEEEWRAHWAFYKLAIVQRDSAWREIEELKAQMKAMAVGAEAR